MVSLNSATSVKFSFGLKKSIIGGFLSIEVTNMNFTSRNCYSGTPFAKAWSDSAKSRQLIDLQFPSILKVYLLANISEIRDSVVGLDAIYMVNNAFRLLSVNPKPRHSVCIFFFSANSHCDVPIAICIYQLLAKWIPMNAMKSCKDSSSVVVLKERLESRLIKRRIWLSHAVVPYKQWCGQKPRRVSSTSGLRYFNSNRGYSIQIITGNVAESNKEAAT